MSVNFKAAYLIGSAVLLLGAACLAFTSPNDFDLAKQEVMLREIGHQILLQSGDSTSRILPVKKIADDEYQITFENEFTFRPDSLVHIIKRALTQNNLAHNYIVNVLKCHSTAVVFGYAILGSKQNNIIPCRGRIQPKSCYLINLKFQPTGITATQKGVLLGGIPMLALVGLLAFSKRRVIENVPAETENPDFKIGYTMFNPQKRLLVCNDTSTELTAKESKLLLIFAESPNVIIERSRLQKEIWEDEGVIVGRSLDVFISKLRKKLEHDTSIQIVNIHGKGYKLKTD